MQNGSNSPLFIGANHIHLAETTSTNAALKTLMAEKRLAEGTVLSTGQQTAGRGQAGTVWEGARDQNIMLSVLLYPKFISTSSQFLISKAVALAVHDLVMSLMPKESVTIKWPNDILIGKRKVCGILIENSLQGGNIESCIVGIGLNVNELQIDPLRISLKNILGIDYNLRHIEKNLFACIEKRYLQLKSHPEDISRDYLAALFGYGEKRQFVDLKENQGFEGTIHGVHRDGRLLVRTAHGEEKLFGLKELAMKERM